SAGGRTVSQARPSAAIAQAAARSADAHPAASLTTRAWSDDMNRVARVTSTPEYGMVALNCVRMSGADPVRRGAAAGARARGLAPRARRAHRAEIRLHRRRGSRLKDIAMPAKPSLKPNVPDLEAMDRAYFFHPSTHLKNHAHGETPCRIVRGGEG